MPAQPAAVSADQAGADPWAAILEAGASLLQGLASARSEKGGAAPIAIEPDPVSGRPTRAGGAAAAGQGLRALAALSVAAPVILSRA